MKVQKIAGMLVLAVYMN